MSTENFKKELESTLLITNWTPTEGNLQEISQRISKLKGDVSKTDVKGIVHNVVGSYECVEIEGVDNTDLTTLLRMATKTTGK